MSRSSALSRFLRIAPAVLLGLLWCAGGLAQVSSQFFPTDHLPKSIAWGPDGAMWFAQEAWFTQEAPKLGRIDSTGTITQFPISTKAGTIALGSDRNLWFTVPTSGRIGRMTTAGEVTEFALPYETSTPNGITPGPDGSLWFTDVGRNQIGRITTSGVITVFPVPTASAGLAGITSGSDGSLWFVEAAANKIGRITTSGTVTEFDLPGESGRYPYPWSIVAGPDGNLWFTHINVARIGRITPAGAITEYQTGADSWAIAAGADGNLWTAGYGTLTRITTSGSVTEFSMPEISGFWDDPAANGWGGMFLAMAAAPDRSIWISDPGNSRIVRVGLALDTTACAADATTLCLVNGRFRVMADWKAGDGSTGHGRGVNLTANSGYFWFFDAANVETVVKVLDGCSANQHHWAFAAGLTNVEVTTTVTDTYTGLSKTYTNPQGTPFAPIQDTAAFATCQ